MTARPTKRCPKCNMSYPEEATFCFVEGAELESGPGDPLLGTTLADRYVLEKLVGRGRLTDVYEAASRAPGSPRVAVKIMHDHVARDPWMNMRFLREARNTSTMQSANIARVLDCGSSADGRPFMIMELVTGRSIADHVDHDGPMEPGRVAHVVAQIGGALAELHSSGIIHGDLKPDSIRLTERPGLRDVVMLLDLGFSRGDREGRGAAGVTESGGARWRAHERERDRGFCHAYDRHLFGDYATPPYASPEQFLGQPLDGRSNIYSLAVMAYEMLTGTLPFNAETVAQWALQHVAAAPMPIEATRTGPSLPWPMRGAVMRALAKSPDQRFATVAEFVAHFTGRSNPAP